MPRLWAQRHSGEIQESMKIFLSSLENNTARIENCAPMHYNLISYYYGRKTEERVKAIIANSELIMIDSGAHTFQKGTHVDWEAYTREYGEWIQRHDSDKILGYFEMDVDNILGYENVVKLRRKLDRVSDKIIPVWHKNRGIADFKNMCREYSGKIVAITGFRNEDIRDEQYMMFLKYAWEQDCRVHCLGMTRKAVLDKVPFDYTDSSSWTQGVLYGRIGDRKLRNAPTVEERYIVRQLQWEASYAEAKKMQEHYEQKWAKITRTTKEGLKHSK